MFNRASKVKVLTTGEDLFEHDAHRKPGCSVSDAVVRPDAERDVRIRFAKGVAVVRV